MHIRTASWSPRRALAVPLLAFAAVLGAVVAPPAAAVAPAPAPAGETRETAEPAAAADRLIVHGRRLGRSSVYRSARQLAPGSWVVQVDPARRDAARRDLARQAGVDNVELDIRFEAAAEPNDPCVQSCSVAGASRNQWYLQKVRAPAAWDVTQGDEAVTVAVLDTGVSMNHEDLVGKVVTKPGCGLGGVSNDTNGHGTAVASIVAANTDNQLGLAGLGWRTKVLAVRVLDSEGFGFSSVISSGIRCAVDNGARIINLSLTAVEYTEAVADAVEYAQSRGAVVLAAAGNEASDQEVFPAALPGVISVGATTQSDGIAAYSNTGRWVDIVAPGSGLVVATPVTASSPNGGYGIITGTSFSVAEVSATIALVLAKDPTVSASAAAARVKRTAQKIPASGRDVETGRLDAGAAVTASRAGYWMVTRSGEVFGFGDSAELGSLPAGQRAPVVAMASTPSAGGYWVASDNGAVSVFGDAPLAGSTANLRLNRPIVGMAATPTGKGYWLVASDGGIFSFGDARFFGSTGNIRLNQPIVGMAATPTGKGYWLVAADGGMFSFGDARFFGSTGSIRLNRPVVGMTPTSSGLGYWLVATDGGIFAFGDAAFFGSTGNIRLNQPIGDMATAPGGKGYWLVATDGGIFSFGEAPFFGSAAGRSASPVVSASAA